MPDTERTNDTQHISEVLKQVMKKLDNQTQEIAHLRREISGRNITGNWVSQKVAEEMLGVGYYGLYNIRKHEKDGTLVGHIRCRKVGRSWEYHKGDIEKYKSHIIVG